MRKTTTCQEQNASNFSVIWQPFNKTRSLCPHTPPLRWRRREADRLSAKRQTEHHMCLFLISTLPTWPLGPRWEISLFLRLFCTSANARTNIYIQTFQVGTFLGKEDILACLSLGGGFKVLTKIEVHTGRCCVVCHSTAAQYLNKIGAATPADKCVRRKSRNERRGRHLGCGSASSTQV